VLRILALEVATRKHEVASSWHAIASAKLVVARDINQSQGLIFNVFLEVLVLKKTRVETSLCLATPTGHYRTPGMSSKKRNRSSHWLGERNR
jgi:hypothetical protein